MQVSSQKLSEKGEEQEYLLPDIGFPMNFLSSNWDLSTTLEDLSKIWSLSLAQAALILKAKTQKLTRSDLMPLDRLYRADRMFDVKRLQCTLSTDTMDAR